MERSDLEHIIRAAGDIAKDDEIIIVGSQSIIGQFPNARGDLILSNEADVYPKNKPEKDELIDVMIREDTQFQETHGYYAQGVGENTAILPKGWEDRLVRVKNENTKGVTGWCIEAHDLALSKCAAGREKDRVFTKALIQQGLVKQEILEQRAELMPISSFAKTIIKAAILRDFKEASPAIKGPGL